MLIYLYQQQCYYKINHLKENKEIILMEKQFPKKKKKWIFIHNKSNRHISMYVYRLTIIN